MSSEAVDGLISATTRKQARKILSTAFTADELAHAYVQRLIALSGQDPQAAARLARYWDLVLEATDRTDLCLRARAIGQRLRAEWLASAASFRASGRAAASPVDRLSFQVGAVDSLARAGQVDQAVRLGRRLVSGLFALGERVQAARVLVNIGNALLWQDRYQPARKAFERALPVLSHDGHELECAIVQLGLSTSELFGGSPARGAELAERARLTFAELELEHYEKLCRVNIAHGALLIGRSDQALDLLLEVRAHFAEADPLEHSHILEFLGDAYQQLNLLSEAELSYMEALARTRNPLNRANCLYGAGLAVRETSPQSARRRLQRASQIYGNLGNRAWAASAMSAIAEMRLQTKRPKHALKAAAEAVDLARRSRSPYHLCRAHLTLAETRLALGTPDRSLTQGAAKAARQNDYVPLSWRAARLLALAEPGSARRLQRYGQMLEEILRARLLVTSTVARASFLQDKSSAIREYLRLLLERDQPMVQEALDAIARCRSATLIDEVLQEPSKLSEEARRRLETIREQLAANVDEGLPGGGARRRAGTPLTARLRRDWVELTRELQALTQIDQTSAAHSGGAVFVDADPALFVLINGRSIRIRMQRAELIARLQWLDFELSAPLLDRDAAARDALHMLVHLREELIDPWIGETDGPVHISPDGIFWAVPWQACLGTMSSVPEPLVLANPKFKMDLRLNGLPPSPRVAIWAFESPDIPEVKSEIDAVRNHFPDAKLFMTLDAVHKSLSETFDLLHVATHGVTNRNNPMFSGLRFEGGMLHATEIARSAFRADIVTLSACETAHMSLASREEPDGIARAFLARGASLVIASSWMLDDRAARIITQSFYERLASGEDALKALSIARAAGRAYKKHPYFWGSLVAFGGYHKGDN